MGGEKDKARTDASGAKSSRLHVKGVSVRFEGLTAIDNFSETIERGEILGLIGPNGAGKTTLVNAMMAKGTFSFIFGFHFHNDDISRIV